MFRPVKVLATGLCDVMESQSGSIKDYDTIGLTKLFWLKNYGEILVCLN